MTIDEAIKHEQNRDYPVSAKYHNQLAEWLEELKDLRKWKDEKCDKCDYFISVEEAYIQGRKDVLVETVIPLSNLEEHNKQIRADAIEEFIKEHTSLNFRGEPYIFITNTEFEQLKEK